MSKEKKNNQVEEVVTEETTVVADTKADKKAEKNAAKTNSKKNKVPVKKENFFKRLWKKLVKLCKDTAGEMKKVVWTPKDELKKNTKLVIITVIAISVVIAVIDTACSMLINGLAGIIG